MKKIVQLIVVMFAAIAANAQTISTEVTSHGLWCDLICLRAKVQKETGQALPFSAYENSVAMQFLIGQESLVSQPDDVLEYDPTTGEIRFSQNNGSLVVLKASTNSIREQDGTFPYYAFVPGIGGCGCGTDATAVSMNGTAYHSRSQHSSRSNSNDTRNSSLENVSTSDAAWVEKTLANHTKPECLCCPKRTFVTCPPAELSRQGALLPTGCMDIDARLKGTFVNNTIAQYWARVLPVLERSFTDTSSESYPEIARYLLCGQLDSLDIRPWGRGDSLYVIANPAMFGPEEIWVTQNGYQVSFVEYRKDAPTKELAAYGVPYSKGMDQINYTLKEHELGGLPLMKFQNVSELSQKVYSQGTTVKVATLGMVKTIKVVDDDKHIIGSIIFDPTGDTENIISIFPKSKHDTDTSGVLFPFKSDKKIKDKKLEKTYKRVVASLEAVKT